MRQDEKAFQIAGHDGKETYLLTPYGKLEFQEIPTP